MCDPLVLGLVSCGWGGVPPSVPSPDPSSCYVLGSPGDADATGLGSRSFVCFLNKSFEVCLCCRGDLKVCMNFQEKSSKIFHTCYTVWFNPHIPHHKPAHGPARPDSRVLCGKTGNWQVGCVTFPMNACPLRGPRGEAHTNLSEMKLDINK